MTHRHLGPARVVLVGDNATTSKYIPFARSLLGGLIDRLSLAGILSGANSLILPDATIRVSVDGAIPSILIYASPVTTGLSLTPPPGTYPLWIPRGFVVYPASDDAIGGWGLPIIQSGGVPPTAPRNIAPGTNVLDWTVNGGLGQVLLTRVPNAGYPKPTTILAPLLFDFTTGLHPKKSNPVQDVALDAPQGDWFAYRLELTPIVANSTTATGVEADAIILNKQTEFNLINNHRIGMSLTPLNYPLRGYFDSGQITAEMQYASAVLAHYCNLLPDTYQTPEDRAGHDGTTVEVNASLANSVNSTFSAGEILYSSNGNVTIIGVDPNGENIYTLAGVAPDVTAGEAFAWWMGSPGHRAIIEGAEFTSANSFLYPGFKKTIAACEFVLHEQWINTGNQYWYSNNAAIPALSWFGPHSLNLAWETWPMDPSGDALDPLIERSPFVLPFMSEGLCWLTYYFTADLFTQAWDNRIFCRGRCIAVAPNGALVWASAIQVIPATGSTPVIYRLVALVHDQTEQPADVKNNGMTSILHIWYVDLPDQFGYAGNPQTVIKGIYGHEDTSWPWITLNSPFSWRDAGTIDVSRSVPFGVRDMLKYKSQWRFSSDGLRACCLRDLGQYTDYADLWFGFTDSGGFNPAGYLTPAAIEIVFDAPEYNTAPVFSFIYHGVAPGSSTIVAPPDPISGQVVQGMQALAIDYGADNVTLQTAFQVQLGPAEFMGPPAGFDTQDGQFGRFYIGFGPYSTTDMAALTYLNEVGAFISRTDVPTHIPFPSNIPILDVIDGVFATTGTRSASLAQPDDEEVGIINPDYTECFLNTTVPVIKIDIFRQGVNINSQWYPNPDFTIYNQDDVNPTSGTVYYTRLSINDLILCSYARTRNELLNGGNDEWLFTYVFTPQPFLTVNADAASFDCITFHPGRYPTVISGDLRNNGIADILCRGGWCSSSFSNEVGLHNEIGTTGPNPRLLYARVV